MPRGFGRRLLAVLALLATAGCASLSPSEAARPHFLAGVDAERAIEEQVGDVIAEAQPALHVGRAHCPFLMNLTGSGARGHCTLSVETLSMRVDITNGYYRNAEDVRLVDAIVVERTAERDLESELARRYGVTFHVRCEGDAIRVVRIAEPQECTATGPDGLRKVLPSMPVGENGSLTPPERLPGVPTLAERIFGRDVAERRSGGITVRGRDVERYLAADAGAVRGPDLHARNLARAPHCPAQISVNGQRRVSCTVPVGDAHVTYAVRFDEGRGLVISSDGDNSPFSVAVLQERARRSFERQFAREGKPQRAVADCGKQTVVLLEHGGSIACTLRTFAEQFAFSITYVSDENGGTFRYEFTDD